MRTVRRVCKGKISEKEFVKLLFFSVMLFTRTGVGIALILFRSISDIQLQCIFTLSSSLLLKITKCAYTKLKIFSKILALF